MRKIIALAILFIFCSVSIVIASNAQRQLSSGLETSNTTIVNTSSEIFGVVMIPDLTGGWAAIYDSSSSTLTGKTVLLELSDATAYETVIKDFPEGLNAYEGIYLAIQNATAIIYYHERF